MNRLMAQLGMTVPVVQAPMAGCSTPEMAAAVCNAGGLGSIGVGSMDSRRARAAIRAVRERTGRPFNVNVFCHRPAVSRPDLEAAWIERLRPRFAEVGATPPTVLKEIYLSFVADDAMLAMLVEERPAIVSFHFGLPPADRITALKHVGVVLFATACSLAQADAWVSAGIDAIVAQGVEAGGHRGVFDPDATDDGLTTLALTRLLAQRFDVPIIAAGGIMDGAGIAAALDLGASAAQLGTAFIGCPESVADDGFRAALFSEAAHHTILTRAISGRPARCLANGFTEFGQGVPASEFPDYPIAYDAGKSLHAAAKRAGDYRYGAQWAGQGAPLARALPAGELVATLAEEWRARRRR